MSIKKQIKKKSSDNPSKTPIPQKQNPQGQIFFEFKNQKDPGIEYAADYVSEGITGPWFSVTVKPGGKSFSQKKAWEIFRKNATFDDVFKGLRTYDIHDVVVSQGKPDFFDYQKWSDRKFLRELGLHSEWLLYPETNARTRMISLLKTTQVENSDKAREVRENLKQCLIPKRPGKCASYPENLEEGMFLLKDLSKYIASQCRDFLCGEDVNKKYTDLQEWGKEEEPQIVDMSLGDLVLLIYKPALFAQRKLSKKLFVSPASLKSALKRYK